MPRSPKSKPKAVAARDRQFWSWTKINNFPKAQKDDLIAQLMDQLHEDGHLTLDLRSIQAQYTMEEGIRRQIERMPPAFRALHTQRGAEMRRRLRLLVSARKREYLAAKEGRKKKSTSPKQSPKQSPKGERRRAQPQQTQPAQAKPEQTQSEQSQHKQPELLPTEPATESEKEQLQRIKKGSPDASGDRSKYIRDDNIFVYGSEDDVDNLLELRVLELSTLHPEKQPENRIPISTIQFERFQELVRPLGYDPEKHDICFLNIEVRNRRQTVVVDSKNGVISGLLMMQIRGNPIEFFLRDKEEG
ncbi:hypothetical protein EYZ11_006656 [Aspergillus tanneri]|uniref:Uncharacterized protein n=1 Tax=Aspergillus tanneri TaxID=1220188 RepID=A0A4V3UP68_9EURO|nr:uncharacterized protein ATNIH1004_010768 [Aspergillus tanneri]KAA8641829.1 hypothetical protein ATNIH1004_010768 [Aspergillus tanneri]THC93874.1 hypothetical protein EYZ11_006656 [Aspergillus tanneri]